MTTTNHQLKLESPTSAGVAVAPSAPALAGPSRFKGENVDTQRMADRQAQFAADLMRLREQSRPLAVGDKVVITVGWYRGSPATVTHVEERGVTLFLDNGCTEWYYRPDQLQRMGVAPLVRDGLTATRAAGL